MHGRQFNLNRFNICSKPTKIEWRYTEDGDRVRVSIRTGRIIPMPKMAEETMDYKTKSVYLGTLNI